MPKLGLLATISYAYEPITGPLAECKLQEAEKAAQQLREFTGDEIFFPGLVSNVAEGENAGTRFREEDVYGIIVLSTIAAMAAYPWAALESNDVPVVVWSRTPAHPNPKTTAEQVRETSPIGSTAIGNVLARYRRQFVSTNGSELSQRALTYLRGARAARQLRGAVLGHVGGESWPGMFDIVIDRARLEGALGLRIVDLDLRASTPPAEKQKYPHDNLQEIAYQRSLELAGQVEEAVGRHDAIGGTIVCHGAQIAQNEKIGVVGCLAVNRLSSRGIPFSCTGDDCVAVALCLGNMLAGAAQYLEVDPVMPEYEAVMVSIGGEGDLRMARQEPPVKICGNRLFGGKVGYGAAHDFVIRPGEATILNFTPIGETFRLIAAEGKILEEKPPELGVPRGLFRFNRPAREAFDAWCEAGANHHMALVPGHHAAAAEAFANITGIEFRRVC